MSGREPYYTMLDDLLVDQSLTEPAPGRRLAVTGGRDFDNLGHVWSFLDVAHHFDPIGELGAGCARGVDQLALGWAVTNGVAWRRYNADWERYGTAAGSRRNQVMLEDFEPVILFVFPGGVGTTDCARRARKLNIEREFCDLPEGDPFEEAAKWG